MPKAPKFAKENIIQYKNSPTFASVEFIKIAPRINPAWEIELNVSIFLIFLELRATIFAKLIVIMAKIKSMLLTLSMPKSRSNTLSTTINAANFGTIDINPAKISFDEL